MKKLLLIVCISLFVLPMSAQFRAKMYFTSMGKDHVFTVFSSDTGYRYEFNEDGQEGIIIVKKGSSDIVVIMPQQKMAMKSSTTDKMSMGNDPVASYKYYQDQGTMKAEGEETVNGITCTRSGLWNKENPSQKMFTVWTAEKYDLPIKMINHIDGSADGSVMGLKDIESWSPTTESYEIPQGYQVMDMPNMVP